METPNLSNAKGHEDFKVEIAQFRDLMKKHFAIMAIRESALMFGNN